MQPIPSAVKGAGAPPRIAYRFRALPCETTSSRAISQSAKILHAVLLDAGRRKGACTYTNRSLGDMIGRSRATVKRLLAELEAAGLARRELSAGGRIRSGVVPIAPGVAHSQAAERTGVAQARPEGGSSPDGGVAHSRSASIQSSSQREIPDGGASPSNGGEAADYLRRCVAAAKRGEPMPPPPTSQEFLGRSPQAEAVPAPTVEIISTVATTPVAPPDAFMPSVGLMVASLADRLRSEDVGRRRVSPAKLARQLAEMRRRHGRRGRSSSCQI